MIVEQFWTTHTVRDEPFGSAAESLAHLDWRRDAYPLFHELMGLWGDHRDDTILDYGCGPGNDMVGFLVHGHAKRVIGMDVSATALELARRRLGLHDVDGRWELQRVSDEQPGIPLETGSVDHVYCEGVLHHASHPAEIVREFHRVLRPGGTAALMVYNYDSIYLHLLVAYRRQILDGLGGTVEEAFRQTTDRASSPPISIPYRPADVLAMCRAAGFHAAFLGGYYDADRELDLYRTLVVDERLAPEHREFLRGLEGDPPLYDGLPAGIGGVYLLRR